MTTRRNALQRATESCGYISGPPICNRVYRFGPPASFFNKFLVPATGEVEVSGVQVHNREGLVVENEGMIAIKALTDSELVLVVTVK